MPGKTEDIYRFDETEMDVKGHYPGMAPGSDGAPVLNTPISPKENIRKFIKGEDVLWMPSSCEEVMFNPSVLPDNVARGLVMEAGRRSSSSLINKDYFGIEWEFVPAVRGAMVRPGNEPVADISKWDEYITFPDPGTFNWEESAAMNAEYISGGRAVKMTVFTGLFERLISFVGMQEALVALADEDEQPYVHRLFDRLCDFYDELFSYLSKWFSPDLLWFHDDWGSQRAPLFSPSACMEMIAPYLKRVVDSAHRYGMGFEFHCCGLVGELVPAMIYAGADMWDGQIINDKKTLYREYGQDIKLGVDLPPLKENASETDIEDIVEEFLETYPQNAFVGMECRADIRYYKSVYRQSRVKCCGSAFIR